MGKHRDPNFASTLGDVVSQSVRLFWTKLIHLNSLQKV